MKKKHTDYRMAAMVLEVERRRKLPGLTNYSYGRLIADTTPEQRQEIVKRYQQSHNRTDGCKTKYKETDDAEDLQKVKQQAQQAGQPLGLLQEY